MKKIKIAAYIKIIICAAACFLSASESGKSVIRWKDVPYSDGYIVEIRDSAGKTVVKKTTDKNHYKIDDLFEGEYEFRLTVINRLGEPEVSSDWKRFRVVKTAKPEKLLSEPELTDQFPRHPQDSIKFHAAFMPSIFIPTGILGELFHPGAGIQAMTGLREFPSENFETGISAGIYMLPGDKTRGLRGLIHISYFLYSGYRISFSGKYSVFPYAGAGYNHSYASVLSKYNIETLHYINFSINAGITLARVYNNYYIPLGFAVDLLYDESEFIPCYKIYSGIGFMF